MTTWGEEFIEDGIAVADFEDGCSATYDRFEVQFASATLLEVDETVVGDAPVSRVDLVEAGPQQLGTVEVRPGDYQRVYYEIGPDTDDAVRTAGTVTCGGDTVTFDWSFSAATRYRCLPLDISAAAGDQVTTELTVHGDHLFFDSLDEDGGLLRGQAIVDADANEDGSVTLVELEAVRITDLGYPVGTVVGIDHFADFVGHLVQSVGHVNGEGHCFVDDA
ncbi:MAG: hypothetical protein KTR31_33360 [Myxococcales bacterium]|nr:hypothetical protein [Myxococcales bacterium]